MSRRILIRVAILILFSGIVSGLFLYRESIKHELSLIEKVEYLIDTRELSEAQSLLDDYRGTLESRILDRFSLTSPHLLILHGFVAFRLGDYGSALGLYEHALEICETAREPLLISQEVCREIEHEAYVHAGDAVVKRQRGNTLELALYYYEEGLRRDHDDRGTKQALEWLLTYKEMMEKKGEKEEGIQLNRGGDPFFLIPPQGNDEGSKEKGY